MFKRAGRAPVKLDVLSELHRVVFVSTAVGLNEICSHVSYSSASIIRPPRTHNSSRLGLRPLGHGAFWTWMNAKERMHEHASYRYGPRICAQRVAEPQRFQIALLQSVKPRYCTD